MNMKHAAYLPKLEHELRCARVADRLLQQGVPPNFIAANIDSVNLPALVQAQAKPPVAVRGKKIGAEAFVLENVRRSISATVLTSIFLSMEREHRSSGEMSKELFAEIFANTWDAFCAAMHPMPARRLDVDARHAWVFLRHVVAGDLKISTCQTCEAKYPKIITPGSHTCIICSQIALAHCSGCGAKSTYTQKLYDARCKDGETTAFCTSCRKIHFRKKRSLKKLM